MVDDGVPLASRRTLLKTTLAGGLFAGASGSVTADDSASVPDAELAVVPLDDRPANTYFPSMTAATGGIATRTPPGDVIGRFTTPGDGEALGEWLVSQGDVDGYVISISMLAYGGLIASRTGELSIAEARENVAVMDELRTLEPDKPIYAYDTIQRLAVTALGEDAEEYYSLVQEWAILVDRVENLGHEEYRDRLEETESKIPDAVIQDYLAARERNHQINRTMIEWAADGLVDHLVLAQDDAAEYGLHRAEREALVDHIDQLDVEDDVTVFPGADEVDAVLVARFAQQDSGVNLPVSVDYAGQHGSRWIAPLEDIPFDENVTRHLEAAGAVRSEDAEIELFVNTPSADDADRATDLDAFVDRIDRHLQAGGDAVVVDPVYTNRADEALIRRLEGELSLPDLLAYSGWNTAGNALGIALGHGLTRMSFLGRSDRGFGVPALVDPAEAHVDYLLHRFTLDDYWKNDLQPRAYSRGREMGANIWGLEPDEKAELETYVRDDLVAHVAAYHDEQFEGRTVTVGHRGKRSFDGEIGALDSVEVALPWPRLFETTLEPRTTVTMEAD